MIEPIIITKYGEALAPYPGSAEKREPEKYKLSTCVGVHAICDGWIDINEVSPTHSALTCRVCKLRVVIPKEVDTWAKLQEYMRTEVLFQAFKPFS
jgi:hypothetical protein